MSNSLHNPRGTAGQAFAKSSRLRLRQPGVDDANAPAGTGHRWNQLQARCDPEEAATELSGHSSRGLVDEDALGATAPAIRFAKKRFRRRSGSVWREYCAERDLFTAVWPCSTRDIEFWPNKDVLLAEWAERDLTDDVGYGGAPVYVWKEAELVGLALHFARQIINSQVWREAELRDFYARQRGLNQAIADIRLRAHRIWRLRANAAPGLPVDPGARSAAAEVWSALVDEVAELGDLADAVTTMYDVEASLPQASTRLDHDERQIYVDAALLELANPSVTPEPAKHR